MTLWLKQLLVTWNVCRIVRIAAGLPIMIMGIRQHDWPTIAFGAAFLMAGLLSVQCCSAGTCNTGRPVGNKIANRLPDDADIEFEELKNN